MQVPQPQSARPGGGGPSPQTQMDGEAQDRLGRALQNAAPASPKGVRVLARQAKRAPDDFALQRQLASALSKTRADPKIVKLWDRYLARHPDDGRALLERSGAYLSLGRTPEGIADAKRACELGMGQGCRRAALAVEPVRR